LLIPRADDSLGTVYKRRLRKIVKNWPCVSVRTHHKSRKIRVFCTKKCGRPHLMKPPCPQIVRAGQTSSPWLRTSFMDSFLWRSVYCLHLWYAGFNRSK